MESGAPSANCSAVLWDKRCLRNVSYDNNEKIPVSLCHGVVLEVTHMQRGKEWAPGRGVFMRAQH